MPVSDAPVLVTGVTGFVGAEVTKQLLAEGYRVRGTTRNSSKARAEGHVTDLPGAEERLELVDADVLDPDSIRAAIGGCEYILHVASPYQLNVEDPQRDLVEPSLSGTTNILEAARDAGSVRRVVLTSSFVAMMGDPEGHVFTESDWNTDATLHRNPYAYSKALAERAAWTMVERSDPAFDLVVINPTVVIGPTLVPRVNQSHEWFTGLTRRSQPAIIAYDFPGVDVRDVAAAHIRALENPAASGRYLASSGRLTHRRIAEIGRELGMDAKYPTPKLHLDRGIGIPLTRIALLFQPKGTRDYVEETLGRTYVVDNGKIRRDLGIEFIPIDQSIRDTWIDLDRWGLLGST